jgi:hypothetical protein
VTATVAANTAKDITSFNFEGLTPSVTGVIEGTNITLNVPYGTDITNLVPTVGITGASVSPASGATQDFTSPVTYTVTAADSSTQVYTVTVIVAAPSDLTLLKAAIATAQSKYDAAVEGNSVGEYPAPLKANLQTAINTASAITPASAQSVVDAAVTTLNAAVSTFEAGIVLPDTTPPVITLNGSATTSVALGNVFVDPGATATDNHDSSVTVVVGGDTVNTAIAGIYTITYNAVDAAGNNATQKTREVVVSGTTLDVTTTTNGDGTKSGVLTNATTLATSTPAGDVTIDMPANLTISGPSGWDGTINLPAVTTSYTLTPDSGDTASAVSAIEIGFGDTPLTLDKAVKLTFTGQAGKLIGWSQSGTFHSITATCDSATSPTLAAGADCKIDVSGDLVVWTKHFTSFVTYTQTAILATVSYGGGGGGTTYYNLNVTKTGTGSGSIMANGSACNGSCSFSYGTTVTLTATPASGSSFSGWTGACSGSASTCSVVLNGNQTVGASFILGQVLGESAINSHPNGTLILDGQTIYLIQNQKRYGFRNEAEYLSYGYKFSQAVVINDADRLLPTGDILKAMTGTVVLDGSDNRTVYLIGANSVKRGFTSAEVFTALGYSFAGLPVINLADYPAGDPIASSTAAHPEGALVLDSAGTVWWILNGQRDGFESITVFNTYGFTFDRVVPANSADMALPVGPLVKLRDGTLISQGGVTYIISDGLKVSFASSAALTSRGYNPANVVPADVSGYTAGATLP